MGLLDFLFEPELNAKGYYSFSIMLFFVRNLLKDGFIGSLVDFRIANNKSRMYATSKAGCNSWLTVDFMLDDFSLFT